MLGIAALLAGAAWSGWETWRNLERHDAYLAAVTAQPDPAARDEAQAAAVAAWEETAGEFVSGPDDIAASIRHIGALLLFVRSGALGWLRRGLAAVGQMAVTNYLTPSLLALIVFILLEQFGQWERHQLYYFVLAVWAAQLVVSPWWLRHFRFGPVEWVWRWLTSAATADAAGGCGAARRRLGRLHRETDPRGDQG